MEILDPARQEEAKNYAKARRRLAFSDLGLAGVLLLYLVFAGLSIRLTGLFSLPVVALEVAADEYTLRSTELLTNRQYRARLLQQHIL